MSFSYPFIYHDVILSHECNIILDLSNNYVKENKVFYTYQIYAKITLFRTFTMKTNSAYFSLTC